MVNETEVKVEESVVVQEEAKAPELPPHTPLEMQAALFLKNAIPRRKALLYKASAAVLRRVTAALDVAPFEEGFRPTMGEEKELYELGLQIVNAKSILLNKELSTMIDKQSQETEIKGNENG